MSGAVVDAPTWPGEPSRWCATELIDRGVRYADKLELRNGWIYKSIGDRHPDFGVLAVPDWAPASDGAPGFPSRNGMVKVRDHRWPDGSRSPRQFALADVPLYGRRYEVIPDTEIVKHTIPEHVTQGILDGHIPAPIEVRRVLEELVAWTGGQTHVVGLNGSFACGLGREHSDVDIDIYGAEAIEAVSNSLSCERLPPGWTRRWPPDEQTNLYYVQLAAYRGMDPDLLREAFHASRRDIFNFSVHGKRVSLSYHSRSRSDELSDAPKVSGERGEARKYSARLPNEPTWGRFDLPAVFAVEHVVADDTVIENEAWVVSDSKAFGFVRPGETVSFVACAVRSSLGAAFVMPSYGPEWPVWPVSIR